MPDVPLYVFHIPLIWDPTGVQWTRLLTYIQDNDLDVGENFNRRELSNFDQATLRQLSEYTSQYNIRVIRVAQWAEE